MSGSAPRYRKRSVHLETEATYGTAPATADGSASTYIPAEGITFADELEVIETQHSTGRNYPSPSEPGADGASCAFQTPAIGLSAAAGNGVNADTITDDWLDLLLLHTFGVQETSAGISLSAVADAASITPTSVVHTAQQLLALYEAGVPTVPRTQWQLIGGLSGGAYTPLIPGLADFGNDPLTSGGVAYGSKSYRDDDDGGDPLTAYITDDTLVYRCSGGRVTRCVLRAEAKRRFMFDWAMSFDSKTEDVATVDSLPAAAPVAPTSLKMMLSPVVFNGVIIPTRSIEIDFGVRASEISDGGGANGRGGFDLVSIEPTITIEPLRSDGYLDYKRNGTTGRILAQIGGGVVSAGVLNSMAVVFDQAKAREVTDRDENGRTRQRLRFHAEDRIEFSAGVGARFLQIARA